MDALENRLKEWTNEFTNVEKHDMCAYNLGSILSLKLVKVVRPFLDACLEYWDPDLHVFAFPGGDICPFPEEIAAIGGWDPDDVPAIPLSSQGYKNKFRDLLGLTKAEVDRYVTSKGVRMFDFVDRFINRNDPTISYVARRRAFGFCLLHCYIFQGHVDKEMRGDPLFLNLVEQLELRKSPACLCLGEIILGLDNRKANRELPYLGSPIILQIWLMERLRLIEPPVNMPGYRARSIAMRTRLYMVDFTRVCNYWENKLKSEGGPLIRWIVPWWHLRSLTGVSSLDPTRSIRIPGLEFMVCIFPERLLRQVGLKQKIPRRDTVPQTALAHTAESCREWATRWAQRNMWFIPVPVGSLWVSDSYLQWRKAGTSEEREKLRKHEPVDYKIRDVAKENQKYLTEAEEEAGFLVIRPAKKPKTTPVAKVSKVYVEKNGKARPRERPLVIRSVVTQERPARGRDKKPDKGDKGKGKMEE